MDSIIFLAPISCFDETLREDRKVNRLEDSYLLWRTVCSSQLLAKIQIILFLNKCDLLQTKLKRGILVKNHIRSYGNGSNDPVSVTKCE
jgi:guanine nucleotide-binding protein alpha-1 subunit